MELETFKKIEPLLYCSKFLEHGLRLDGRSSFLQARQIHSMPSLIPSRAFSATVKMGNTVVVAAVTCQVAEVTNPLEKIGYIILNADLSAACDSKFKGPSPSPLSQHISAQLDEIFSHVYEPKDLYLDELGLCWAVWVDIVCISFDGNVLDCCVKAARDILSELRLPDLEVTEEGIVVEITEPIHPINLKVLPYSYSFAVVADKLLLDPNGDEQKVATAEIVIILNDNGEMIKCNSIGNISLQMINEAILAAIQAYSKDR